MSRSKWKGNWLLYNTIVNNQKIFRRDNVVPFSAIGKNVMIHNGKEFKKVFITRESVGFKFGEFAPTRTHSPRKKEAGK